MKFTLTILTVAFSLNLIGQQTEFTLLKAGNILHYKGSVVTNEDSTNIIDDFAIRIDSIIHYKCGSTIIIFSKFIDDLFSPYGESNKTIFLIYKKKIFTISVNDEKKFAQDYFKKFAYWNKHLRDTLTNSDSYQNFKKNIYNFIPFINLNNPSPCSSIAENHKPLNYTTFPCLVKNSEFSLSNKEIKIKQFHFAGEREAEDYYYSDQFGIVQVTGVSQVQDTFYNFDLKLDKVE